MLEVRNTFCEKMSAIFGIYYDFAFLFSEISAQFELGKTCI